MSIPETNFIDILKDGVNRTASYMAKLTEYRGGPAETEYILTADIARAFLDKSFEVRVECLNRYLVNGITSRKNWVPRESLGRKRTDIAITGSGIMPLAMVEVKIRVRGTLSPILKDLNKIANTLECMNARVAASARAASVFQVFVPGRADDLKVNRLKGKIDEIEAKHEMELKKFADGWPDFSFRLVPLQKKNDGFVTTEIVQEDDNTESLGQNGHAIRYYAVLVASTRRQEKTNTFRERFQGD